ncbi:Hypothetical Protein FCC1311_079762 [Hondaea fermentalgiana]|uniref:CID domain-containing protein n=1 Tax=Hondaea fermentalgiana TaxID=2315210 RepID=A0A2R5GTN3_9STRA|nr:Hypothetical Protein FCC1311_079762 [Hondaea fermentalgiana]|eukprot:GBG31751.1 Hypothetical Protein FCC1311_079762 [Hondaea fermentalgiana]
MSSKRRKKAESEVAKLLDLGDGSGGASSGTDHVGGANNGDVGIELSENRKQKLQTLLTKVVREKDGAREARTWIMAHPRCARAIGAELESLVCRKSKTGSGGKKLMVLRVLHDVLGKCHAMRSEGKKLPVDYESVWLSVLETAVRECLAPESPEKVVESFNKYFDKWKEKGWLGVGSIAVLDERVREIKRRQKDRAGSTASPSAKAKTTAAPFTNSSTGLTSAFRSARSNATPNRKVAFATKLDAK